MKTAVLHKCILLGLLLAFLLNGCSTSDETTSRNIANLDNTLVFSKSPDVNWHHLKVEVSFEDDLQEFTEINSVSNNTIKSKYTLTANNLRQGITVKLKIIDLDKSIQKTNEIMIESFDLKNGLNEFVIGYKDYKPYIIY